MKNLVKKADIRRAVLAKRDILSGEEWLRRTEAICSKLIKHPCFQKSAAIYCYVDFNNEVGTHSFIEACLKLGKRVAVPKVFSDTMEFFYISDLLGLKQGAFGVMEPIAGDKASGDTGLVVIPGAVFDKQMHRIGYGKGYYDRYLSMHPHLKRIALAFDLQIVEDIPFTEFDISPEFIITETRELS